LNGDGTLSPIDNETGLREPVVWRSARVVSAAAGPFVADQGGAQFINSYDVEAARMARLPMERHVVAQDIRQGSDRG
jgi:hypothetical protein